jgi:ABC-type multidrug transport system fused ATPase/permease subunit
MTDRYSQDDKSLKVVMRLMKLFRKNTKWLVLFVAATLVSGLGSILMAKGIQGVSDAALAGSIKTLYSFLYYVLAALVLGVLSSIVTRYASGKYTSSCMASLLDNSQQHILSLSMGHMDESRSGDLLSRMTNDIHEIWWFLEFVVINMVTNTLILAILLSYMFSLNWQLTLISCIGLPIFTLLVAQVSKKLENQMKQQEESFGNENNVLEDSFMGLAELKAFGLGKMMFQKYSREVDNTTLKSQQLYKTDCKIMPIGSISSKLPYIVTIFFGGYLVYNHSITLGMLLAYLSLINLVTDPIYSILRVTTALRTSVACIRRIFEIWNYPKEREGGSGFPQAVPNEETAISFENVTFGYNPDTLLFKNLSFEIRPGAKVALVGSSGCGKSTVLKLITGFYQPITGRIQVLGCDIDSWGLEALRSQMAEVLQDNYLFPDTIRQNIAYGKQNATAEEIEQAAQAANIIDFIESLPNQYETLVGERGVRLSGGQRQRVAIARALLKNAPILLLDEATSALDTESEREVQASLELLMKNRTTLVIAHRLSTIRNADMILVMEDGQIVETGTHDALLARPSVYRSLYNKQFREDDVGLCLPETEEGLVS